MNNEQAYLAAKEKLSLKGQPSNKTMGQITRDFGKLPPAYLVASRPGPQTGGAYMLLGNQFTHGVMW